MMAGFLDQVLTLEEQTLVECHLVTCHRCRETLKAALPPDGSQPSS